MVRDDAAAEIQMASCRLSGEEIDAATAVLRSGKLVQGAVTARFEEEFAAAMGARYAVACSSGTAAQHLVYGLLLEPGSEVLVPAMTFLSTASMLVAVGCKPVFCDIDPDTWLIDLDDASRKVTARTRAIVPVHLFGNPCDPDAVERFAASHGLAIIGDAAQAHGARFGGRGVASLGRAAIFSLYATKNLFVGEGGVICTDDAVLAEELRRRRSHGIGPGGLVHSLGFNYRLTEMQAAIGLAQLARFDRMCRRRQRNADVLRDRLQAMPGIRFQRIMPAAQHGHHHFCVSIDPDEFGSDREAVAAALKERNICSAVYYRIPPHRQPLFAGSATAAPRTDALCARSLALPVHHDLTDADLDRVADAVRHAGWRA
jgi:dTDP-4-amino-4,6-dideoxygalactose transaminase